jgi:CRP/FNR family transcriptional regulator, dissimilatory nitrate respiration regulator
MPKHVEARIIAEGWADAYDCNHMPRDHRNKRFTEPTNASTYLIAGIAPRLRKVEGGTHVFRQGHKPREIFRLLTGRIRLLRITEPGAEIVMHEVRAGELFAEASLFSAQYHCDAVALEDSTLLSYPKNELVKRFADDSQALWEFTGMLAKRVQALRGNLALRQIRSAPERVMQAIRVRCDSAGKWAPEGTLKQFAEEVGLTHEALYRALAALGRRGEITRNGGEITLNESGKIT